jgi:hypothetical protein
MLAAVVILLFAALFWIYLMNLSKKENEVHVQKRLQEFEKEKKRLLYLSEDERLYEIDCNNIKNHYGDKIDQLHDMMRDIDNNGTYSYDEKFHKRIEIINLIDRFRKEQELKLEEKRKAFWKLKGIKE